MLIGVNLNTLRVKDTVVTLMGRSQPPCSPRRVRHSLELVLTAVPRAPRGSCSAPAARWLLKIQHRSTENDGLPACCSPSRHILHPPMSLRALGWPGQSRGTRIWGCRVFALLPIPTGGRGGSAQGFSFAVGHEWPSALPVRPGAPSPAGAYPTLPSLAAAMDAALIVLCSLLVPVAVADGGYRCLWVPENAAETCWGKCWGRGGGLGQHRAMP